MQCLGQPKRQKDKTESLVMNEINNLTYTLEINYTNGAGTSVSISVKFCDNGLEVKTVRLGNVCISEETINGRVLSGRLDDLNGFCGYRYDYQNGEGLLNINPDIPLNDAILLINKAKMGTDYLSAKMVLSSISRNDYRVVTLNKGNLHTTKTVSAENEKSEQYILQEDVDLLKLDGEESFAQQRKKITYKTADGCETEDAQTIVDGCTRLQFAELAEIASESPQNYKELIEYKNQIQKSYTINEEKTL